jgi:hypothetical protein
MFVFGEIITDKATVHLKSGMILGKWRLCGLWWEGPYKRGSTVIVNNSEYTKYVKSNYRYKE